ncbi:MAG: HAMP domain-containing sensor histidine kinase [Deltaproteobacteria bacterium]|nr:HAMP domain-containing sensor histidine kinase [Deltaproteobacteria bacterium]
MGRINLKGPGTAAAIALTAVAVTIPCAVWYWLGARQLDRVSDQLETGARRETQTTADQVATKMALQLEDLRKVESERSHLHYFPKYLTRGKHCGRLKIQSSPLATGDYPKAVKVYFQIDMNGDITAPRPDARLATLDVPVGGRFDVGANATSNGNLPTSIAPWAFMSQAESGLPATDDQTEVGAFAWHTGRLEGKPALMAIRALVLAGQRYFQGFVVENTNLGNWMFDGGFHAQLKYGPAASHATADVPLPGVGWHVAVDPNVAMATVRTQETALRRQFGYSYLGGVLFALITGAGVVGMVIRSNNFARERSRFAAAAAHELRTPLAGIRLHGEMLAAGLGNPTAVQKYAQRITDEAERLGRVVVNVLNHSKSEQRNLTLQRRSFDVRSLLEDAGEIMAPLVREGGGELVLELGPALGQAEVDRDALMQILNNLIDNAEKYSRGAAMDRRIHLRAHLENDALCVAVSDHGPGVPLDMQPRMFKPFVGADTATKTAGLGLGLSVVWSLVRAHGGDVRYEETAGGGSTFVLSFPVAPAQSTTVMAARAVLS